MDSLTQIAVGIATAEFCLGKQLKNRTFLYGAILATLPDLDIYVGKLFNPITAISLHRGFSHSILFFLLASVPLGALMYKIEHKKIKIFSAISACFLILFTHALLDAFTTWGTQIFWPLPYRLALKSVFVVDFFYTLPWVICLYMVYKNKQSVLRLKWLKIGFYLTTSYLVLGLLLKQYVTYCFESELKKQNIAYKALIVKPTFSNIVLWNANVMTEDAFLLSDFSVFDAKPTPFKHYKRNLEFGKTYQNAPPFLALENISEGWYTLQANNGSLIFNDLRFGILKNDPIAPQFAFSYIVKDENGVVTATEAPKQNRDGKKLLLYIFDRIFKTSFSTQ